MKGFSCPRKFACSSNGFAAISHARRFLGDYFICIGEKPACCPHSLYYGCFYYCLCSLLQCVAKELFKARNASELNPLPGRDALTAD